MIDFELPSELEALRERTEAFVRDVVIPYEGDPRETSHGLGDDLKRELIGKAREAGLLSPHVGKAYGGLGLDMRSMSVVFEAAGYSLLGPHALNCAAPDEGNMHLLEAVATEAQKEQWLRPLAAGEIRSCFSMTEPEGGAGSDPNMLSTTARPDGNHWVVNGHKWLITGFDGARLNIIMARTAERIEGGQGATMFLVTTMIPRSSPSAARTPWRAALWAGTTRSNSTISGSPRIKCSERSGKVTATPRSGSPPRV